jgi:20S proteasome subunit beta 6
MSYLEGLDHAAMMPTQAPVGHHHFDPYDDNGGTSLSIAGEDFCLLAADTRQSAGYHINARYAPKAWKVSSKAVLSCDGFYADGLTLVKLVRQRIVWYHHSHEKEMSVAALAQMLQTILYGKRFFPYYSACILAGLDENGKGAIYAFDPVGSYERVTYVAHGSSTSLVQPFLDNQVGFKNQHGVQRHLLDRQTALRLTKDAFIGATERDIHTGDYLELFVIDKDGINVEKMDLKKD